MAIKQSIRMPAANEVAYKVQQEGLNRASDGMALVGLAYDYDQIDAAHRDAVRMAAGNIKARLHRTQEDLLAIGEALVRVKGMLPHGQFQEWIETEFDLGYRTAKRMMDVAQQYADKSDTVSLLKPSVLYLLAAESTPDAARVETEMHARAGSPVTKARAAEIINKHKDAPPPTPVREIEYSLRVWLDTVAGGETLLRDLIDQQIMHSRWLGLIDSLPQQSRKRDIMQALHNVLEQLQQQAAQPQPDPKPAQPRALDLLETKKLINTVMIEHGPQGDDQTPDLWIRRFEWIQEHSAPGNYLDAAPPGSRFDWGIFVEARGEVRDYCKRFAISRARECVDNVWLAKHDMELTMHVMGGWAYRRRLPEGGYIDSRKFETPEEAMAAARFEIVEREQPQEAISDKERQRRTRISNRLVKDGWGFIHDMDGTVSVSAPCGLGTLGPFTDKGAAVDAALDAEQTRVRPVELPPALAKTNRCCLFVGPGLIDPEPYMEYYYAETFGDGLGPNRMTFEIQDDAIAWLKDDLASRRQAFQAQMERYERPQSAPPEPAEKPNDDAITITLPRAVAEALHSHVQFGVAARYLATETRAVIRAVLEEALNEA